MVIAATVLSTLNEYLDTPFMKTILNSKVNAKEEEQQVDSKNLKTDTFLNKFLSCFSLKRNLPKLFSASNEDEIKCLHGLKAISIILLFISLRLIPMGRVPYTNRNKFTEFFNSPLSVFLRSSFLYEDAFLVISGFLAALSVIKEISAGGNIVWLKKVFARYLRLMLPLSFVVLFYAYLFEHIGTGPQWNLVTKNSELCQENSWKNLLFIQNFSPFEDMVRDVRIYMLFITNQLLTVRSTHVPLGRRFTALHLDTFTSVVNLQKSNIRIWNLRNHTCSLSWCSILGCERLPPVNGRVPRNEVSIKNSRINYCQLFDFFLCSFRLSQLYRTFNLSFAVALHRATPYLIGVALGIAHKEFGKVQLPKGVAYSGWLATISALIWCYYKPSNLSHKDYQYDPVR